MENIRIGFGYDIHRLVSGRYLILGGVKIPFEKGLEGHSDADVVIHAIIDAVLGAMGEGDIGTHFPDTDPKYEDISSCKLLENIKMIIDKKKYQIVNIDVSINLEKPRLNPFINEMSSIVAACLNIEPDQVNTKAKTNERLGPIGEGKAIACYAVALLTKKLET